MRFIILLILILAAPPAMSVEMLVNTPVAHTQTVSVDEAKAELINKLVCSNLMSAFKNFFRSNASVDADVAQSSYLAAKDFLDHIISSSNTYYPLKGHPLSRSAKAKWVDVSQVLRAATLIPQDSVLLKRPDHLKYIPHSIESLHLIVLARDGDGLSSNQMNRVIKAAKASQQTISVIVINEALSSSDRDLLSLLPDNTGGFLIDLTQIRRQCFPDGQI